MAETIDHAALERALAALPEAFRGPGGVAGVVADGRVVARHAWGHADLAQGRAMTAALRLPICSISKQFTCAALLDLVGDPARLDDRVAGFLPGLRGERPRIADLCNMQSGLRDYWATTVLQGAQHDGVFARADARPHLAALRSTHFAPGMGYSYSNGNFRMLSDIIEEEAGRSLGELYAGRIFARAGMETAELTPDTSHPADGVVGYEGNEQTGFFPAQNRIFWTGDAGISASLDDMLAWERFIDATREDAQGLYRRLSGPPRFRDGAPAAYGFGLAHEELGGVHITGHGGALRGFRLQRLHAASRRVSVVVLLNHEADVHAAALSLMRAALGLGEEPAPGRAVDPAWAGSYLDRDNGLLLTVAAQGGEIEARYAGGADRLRATNGGMSATGPEMTLAREEGGLRLTRPRDRIAAHARRVLPGEEPGGGVEGRYASDETGGTLVIASAGGALHGRFTGLLGEGPVHPVHPVGRDLFVLSCPRSMDAPAPGDWTIQIRRDGGGRVSGLVIGCWLARNLPYRKEA